MRTRIALWLGVWLMGTVVHAADHFSPENLPLTETEFADLDDSSKFEPCGVDCQPAIRSATLPGLFLCQDPRTQALVSVNTGYYAKGSEQNCCTTSVELVPNIEQFSPGGCTGGKLAVGVRFRGSDDSPKDFEYLCAGLGKEDATLMLGAPEPILHLTSDEIEPTSDEQFFPYLKPLLLKLHDDDVCVCNRGTFLVDGGGAKAQAHECSYTCAPFVTKEKQSLPVNNDFQ